MNFSLTRRAFAVLAGTAMISLSAATVAVAAPVEAADQTTASAPAAAASPNDCIGFSVSWGSTCFVANGDDQWVRDLDANGYTTIAHVETSYGKTRDCLALPAADGWGVCKFDHKESSCVRFYMYEKKGSTTGRSTGWSRWYGVARGDDCVIINP